MLVLQYYSIIIVHTIVLSTILIINNNTITITITMMIHHMHADDGERVVSVLEFIFSSGIIVIIN